MFSIMQPWSEGFSGTGLEFVELVARATVVNQMVGVESGTPKGIKTGLVEAVQRDGEQDVKHPARMRWTTGNVDDGQAVTSAKSLAEQTAGQVAVIVQADGPAGVRPAGADAAPGGATAYGQNMAGAGGQVADPVEHGAARTGQEVESARAARPGHHRAFDAKDVEPIPSFGAGAQDVERLGAALDAQAGVPQEADAGIGQALEQGRLFGVEQGQGAAATAAGLEPEQVQRPVGGVFSHHGSPRGQVGLCHVPVR
jgi:hypothetical protein